MEDQQSSSQNAPVIQNSSEVLEPSPSFTWEASEYVEHEKSVGWYLSLWAVAAVISGVLAWQKQWLSIVVIVVMAMSLVVYSRKSPRTLTYALDEKGLSVNGKMMPYAQFKSYSVFQEIAWREINLEPSQRFSPRLTLLCEQEDFDTIEEILAHHLPRVDRDPDPIERLSRYLRF